LLLPRAVGCGFSLGFFSLIEIHMSISPPHVSANDHPICRKVALAYRSTREAGGSHDDAIGFAMMAYFEERPEARADRAAASHQVAVFISSAINADPAWFWRKVKKGDYWRG
jgi:hypothetical protein